MQLLRWKPVIGATAALAFCVSPTVASAATSLHSQPVSPLVAVSVFGTQASAQAVCSGAVGAAAGAASTQAQAKCVLPVVDPAPAPPVAEFVPPPTQGFGISPILLGLAGLALAAGIIVALSDSDDDDEDSEISPA